MDVHLLDRAFYAGDPHPALRELRATEPVYRDPSGMWGLMLHEDVVWAEKRRELFSSADGSRPRTGPQPSMIDSDDPAHLRRRRLVDHGFAAKRVVDYERWIRGIVTELIDAVAPLGRCDLVRDLAAPLPTAVIADLLGIEPKERATLQEWSDAMVAGADGPENVTDSVLEAAGAFTTYITDVIGDRRGAARDDLISVLVHAEIEGERLSAEELWGESLLLLVGGNETTRNVLSGGLYALMCHPDQRTKLVADPSRIPTAAEECLRWVTPVLNMARTTTQDVEVRGRTIPAGEQVLLMYISANRDERVFEDPYTFDVSREPNPHIAFGHGTHYCLGASLARLEIRIMFEEVLRRLPDMEPAEPQMQIRRTPSSFISGIVELPVVFTPER